MESYRKGRPLLASASWPVQEPRGACQENLNSWNPPAHPATVLLPGRQCVPVGGKQHLPDAALAAGGGLGGAQLLLALT